MAKQLISINTGLKNKRIAQFEQYSTQLIAVCVAFKALSINITYDDVVNTLSGIKRPQEANMMLNAVAINQPASVAPSISKILDSFVRTKIVAANESNLKIGGLAINMEMASQLIEVPDLTSLQELIFKLNSIEIDEIKYLGIEKLLTITSGVCTINEDAEDVILERSSYYTSSTNGILRYTKTKAIMDALNDARASNIDVGALAGLTSNERIKIPGIKFNGTQFVLDGDFLSRF